MYSVYTSFLTVHARESRVENFLDVGGGLLALLKVETHGLQESIHTFAQWLVAIQHTGISILRVAKVCIFIKILTYPGVVLNLIFTSNDIWINPEEAIINTRHIISN